MDALERWIRSLCAKGTLLILLEDAQWLDPTSKLLLGRLVAWSSQARILILATTRTEHLDDEYVGLTLEEPWLREPNVNISPLWEFEENDARELVAATAKGRAIPSNLIKNFSYARLKATLFTLRN